MSKRIPYKKVTNFFESNGVHLLTSDKDYYENGILVYITKCNHGIYNFNRTFTYLEKHSSNLYCEKCRHAYGRFAKYTYGYIKQEMNKENCILIEYHNTKRIMTYIASCGHKASIAPRNWRKGGGRLCRKCMLVRIGMGKRNDKFNRILDRIKKIGCSVEKISKDENIIEYRALCGHSRTISYGNISTKDDFVLKYCAACYRPISDEKRIATMVESGKLIDSNNKSEFNVYCSLVWRQTEYNYKIYKDYINPTNIERRNKRYALDHIFSVQQGFIRNIAPEIISHPCNLRIIGWIDNSRKNIKCDISINELRNKIGAFNNVS